MLLPSAILFINADMTSAQIQNLGRQLFISETISDQQFNERISVDPNYPQIIYGQNLRLLVIQQNLKDGYYHHLADVVMFIKQGMIAVEKNKYGPPGATFYQDRLDIWQLLRAADSNQVPILPSPPARPIYPCEQRLGYGLGGIFAIELQASTYSICPNPDTERNNPAFINRK
jgi:hypothetical protein